MKKFLVLLLSVFFISSLYSQPIQETSHTNSYIAVIFYSERSAIIKVMTDEITEYSKNKTPVKVVYSEASQYEQNEMFNEFLDDKSCKAIIIQLVDASSGGLIMKKAERVNKPVIFVNTEPHFEALSQKRNSYYVGSSAEEAGWLQGKMIAEYWNEHKEKIDRNHDNVLQYFIVFGDVGEKVSFVRSEYAINAIVESGIEVERVGKGGGEWTEESGEQAIFKNFGILGHNLEVVIANYDELALGAVTALKKATDFGFAIVPVFGIEGIDKAKESIEAGELTGTIYVDVKSQIRTAYNIALALILGIPITEDNIGYPIDKNNAVWIPII